MCSHPQMIFSTNMTHACLINKLLTKQINYFVLETNSIVKIVQDNSYYLTSDAFNLVTFNSFATKC